MYDIIDLFLIIMLPMCDNSIKTGMQCLLNWERNRSPFSVENYNYLLTPKRIVINITYIDKMLINIKILIR